MQLRAQSPRRGPGAGAPFLSRGPAAAWCHPCRDRPGPSCGAQTRKCLAPLDMRDPERWGTTWHKAREHGRGCVAKGGGVESKNKQWLASAGIREAPGLGARGGAAAEHPSSESQGLCSGSRRSGPSQRLRSGAPWGSLAAGSHCPRQAAARGAPLLGLGISALLSPGAGRKLSRPLCWGTVSPLCWCLRGGRGPRQAASYVQFTTERGAGGSAPGPSPRPQGSGPTKAL